MSISEKQACRKRCEQSLTAPGAKVSLNSDGIYVFEPQSDGGDVSLPDAPSQSDPAPQQSQNENSSSNENSSNSDARLASGDLHYQTIVLQHAVPTDILKLMHWDRDVVDMDPFKPVQMPQSVPSVSSDPAEHDPAEHEPAADVSGLQQWVSIGSHGHRQ